MKTATMYLMGLVLVVLVVSGIVHYILSGAVEQPPEKFEKNVFVGATPTVEATKETTVEQDTPTPEVTKEAPQDNIEKNYEEGKAEIDHLQINVERGMKAIQALMPYIDKLSTLSPNVKVNHEVVEGKNKDESAILYIWFGNLPFKEVNPDISHDNRSSFPTVWSFEPYIDSYSNISWYVDIKLRRDIYTRKLETRVPDRVMRQNELIEYLETSMPRAIALREHNQELNIGIESE